MDTTETITHVSLCAGYGGIDLGLKRAIPTMRTVAFSEIEAFACANLVAKMEAGLLDAAPIWTNLKSFPWDSFCDRVDILSGGYPCQPFSAAGKRLGTEDPRHLWPYIRTGIRAMRPVWCFFENVEGHISLGLSTVISDLEEDGYRCAWGIFSASEVGAPHQRKRVFILAHREGCGRIGSSLPIRQSQGEEQPKANTCWNDYRKEDGALGKELAHRDGERGQLPDRRQLAAVEVPVSDGAERRDVWPSRPGEPQHGWEPPRVVDTEGGKPKLDAMSGGQEGAKRREHCERPLLAGSAGGEPSKMVDTEGKRAGNGRELRDEERGSWGALPRVDQQSGEGVADPQKPGLSGSGKPHIEERQECAEDGASVFRRASDSSNDGGDQNEGVGDTAQHLLDGSRPSGEDWRDEFANAGGRQAEQPMGVRFDGHTDGMGHAELSGLGDSELAEIREWMVRCDNRTDELRLLGNGVVPATAEIAFRTLYEKLMKGEAK